MLDSMSFVKSVIITSGKHGKRGLATVYTKRLGVVTLG